MTASIQSIIESLIFAAETPLSLDRLCELLPEHGREEVKTALNELRSGHEGRGGGFYLTEIAGGWQFRTLPDLQQYIVRLVKTRTAKFSTSALETLAIIAYRQPITRAEIEHLRGVDCGGLLKTLLDKKLVKILGKKDIPGRPLIYGTSKEFLEVFSLKDLKSLPTLKEIQALDESPRFERQEELPLGSATFEQQEGLFPFDH